MVASGESVLRPPLHVARVIAVLLMAVVACQGVARQARMPCDSTAALSQCSEKGRCCCGSSVTHVSCCCCGGDRQAPLPASAPANSAPSLKLALATLGELAAPAEPRLELAVAVRDESTCPSSARSLQTLLCVWRI